MDFNLIKFKTLRRDLKINDFSLFTSYLGNTYKDLAERSENKTKLGISRIIFYNYLNLSLIISEKIFNSFDKDKNNYLNLKEFREGMIRLFQGNFEETLNSIFEIYDFDSDGFINKEDVRIIMFYLPLKIQNVKNDFKQQMDSLDEINEILEHTFENEIELNIDKYRELIKKRVSDTFIHLISFIYKNVPFCLDSIYFYKRNQIQIEKEIINNHDVLIIYPRFTNYLSPFEDYLKITMFLYKSSMLHKKNDDSFDKDNYEKINNRQALLEENSVENLENLIKRELIIYDSPIKNLCQIKGTSNFIENDIVKVSTCNTLYNMNSNYNLPETFFYENIIFKITQKRNFKKYWVVLQGREIFYFKSIKKERLKGMHNIKGCFLKEGKQVVVSGYKFYSFSLIFPKKARSFYIQDKSKYNEWINKLQKAIGQKNVLEFFEIREEIGIGKFGHIRLGINKSTQEKVAIKIIKKSSMKAMDLQQVMYEIDIMKILKHPNVVKLLDLFENSENVYIVMELFQGGDLSQYIYKNQSNINEGKFSNFIYQISCGLYYIHKFGILHRDLKPENIMLTDRSPNPTIKIMDFGLSKFLGSNERVSDGYGTLSFVAPEVLLRKPYNKQIDIWSLGIIMYYGLSGELPFSDESNEESVIAKKIVYDEVKFLTNKWIKRSKEVITLIKKCLIKDPDLRISLQELINFDWLNISY